MHAIRQQESSEEHSTCRQQEGPEAEQWVLVVSIKQSDYHRQQDKVLNRDSRAWRLGVKVTNYQDKDEVLSKSLDNRELMNKQ